MKCPACNSWVFYEQDEHDTYQVCISGHRILLTKWEPLKLIEGNDVRRAKPTMTRVERHTAILRQRRHASTEQAAGA